VQLNDSIVQCNGQENCTQHGAMTEVHVVESWSEGAHVFRPTQPQWMIQAKCKGQTDLFFNEGNSIYVRAAKVICGTCPVRRECLAFAMKNDDQGIWAGTSTNERERIRRSLRKNIRVLS
jgi:WhiB family redox-sensing transcriptional regulator